MDEQSGLEPDMVPTLDEFLLARLAEDKRIATDAAAATGRAAGPSTRGPAPRRRTRTWSSTSYGTTRNASSPSARRSGGW